MKKEAHALGEHLLWFFHPGSVQPHSTRDSLPPRSNAYTLIAALTSLLLKTFLVATALMILGVRLPAAELPLSIDKSHSRIEVVVEGMLHDFTGKLTDYNADILADTTSGKVTKAVLRFKFSDLKTGDEKRDETMLAWAQYDQFPEAVFSLISFDAAKSNKPVARGQLIFHGVVREIDLTVTVVTQDQLVYSIDGETTLDTRDFGLPVLRRYGLFRINPQVTVSFHLQGSTSVK